MPDRVKYADPFRAGRHPFETFTLVLCLMASLPLVFGEPTAGSVEELLPWWVALGWGLSLGLGCAVALLGTHWPIREPLTPESYATSLLLERVGLSIVGPAALVYAALIVLVAGWAGLLASALVAGFGWASIRRMLDVARVFRRAIKQPT